MGLGGRRERGGGEGGRGRGEPQRPSEGGARVRTLVDILKISSPSASMPAGVSGMIVRSEGTDEIIETNDVYSSSMRSSSPA